MLHVARGQPLAMRRSCPSVGRACARCGSRSGEEGDGEENAEVRQDEARQMHKITERSSWRQAAPAASV